MTNPIKLFITTVILLFSLQVNAFAQTSNLTDIIKQHFSETVQNVQSTENADEKRTLLDDSFTRMLEAIDRVESSSALSEDDVAQIQVLKENIQEKRNELNGEDGFDEITDEELDDFSDYAQQDMEQANRTITISLTTALLIVIILLLL